MANHEEFKVLKSLQKKHDLRVNGYTIEILRNKVFNKDGELVNNMQKIGDIGNGTNGKIDFLVNYCGYNTYFVAKF